MSVLARILRGRVDTQRLSGRTDRSPFVGRADQALQSCPIPPKTRTDPGNSAPPAMSLPALSSASASALSGMRAAQLRLDSGAHNVANAQTPGFQRQAVTQSARPGLGGVEAQVVREADTASTSSGDFSHLAQDLVEGRMSVYSFAANLRVVETEERMLGTLLDERA
jgi:Flagella basal body rod protein